MDIDLVSYTSVMRGHWMFEREVVDCLGEEKGGEGGVCSQIRDLREIYFVLYSGR